MTCEELREDYELHALGLLEDPERSALEEHLRNGCQTCTAGVKRAYEVNTAVLGMVPDVAPSRRLRERVITSVGGVSRRSVWNWLGTPAAAVAGLLVGVLLFRSLPVPETPEVARMRQVIELLNDPQTKAVTFAPGPRGRVLVNKDRGVLLIANNLPALPQGRTFELWVIPKGGAPKPAGLFKADQSGNALHVAPGPVDVTTLGAVAVSIEPEAGSQAPTTTPIIVAPVAD
ncbi:MAG TPA: anti-sigma factor [Bryobacteraceae bacterium]|nr:anti-sigma factor [Bryobacteraceae bacterium]